MRSGSNPVMQFADGLRTSFPASFLLGLPQSNMDRLVLPPLFLMPCFARPSPPPVSLEGSKRRFRSYDTHSAGLSPPTIITAYLYRTGNAEHLKHVSRTGSDRGSSEADRIRSDTYWIRQSQLCINISLYGLR